MGSIVMAAGLALYVSAIAVADRVAARRRRRREQAALAVRVANARPEPGLSPAGRWVFDALRAAREGRPVPPHPGRSAARSHPDRMAA